MAFKAAVDCPRLRIGGEPSDSALGHLILRRPRVGTKLLREASIILTRISTNNRPNGSVEHETGERGRFRGQRTSDQQVGGSNPSGRAIHTHAAAVAGRIDCMTPRRSAAWNATFRAVYALLRLMDPLLRWTWFSVGLGITSSLTVRGRRSGRERSVLVGLIRVDGAWYVGHPNGEVAWTANLREAGTARLAPRPEAPVDVTVRPLTNGPERDAVILATSDQQPFPGNLLYGAARRHILSEGRYFRVELR